jgi:site-specific DNA recombinase
MDMTFALKTAPTQKPNHANNTRKAAAKQPAQKKTKTEMVLSLLRRPKGATIEDLGKATDRCAIYTRKSSEEGLEQDFNSLDAQREACEAYIASQKHEGWTCCSRPLYDDGGFSGGSMERPALQQLLADIAAGKIDVVVVYKVDRLTRSLPTSPRSSRSSMRNGVSFVSVTQQFNTTTSWAG